jgi:hypothetical protein
MLQNVSTATETCYRRVTLSSRHSNRSRNVPDTPCRAFTTQVIYMLGPISILIRVTLTNPQLQGFHNYFSNSGFSYEKTLLIQARILYCFYQIQERGNVSLSQLYIVINFIWLHVSTRNESSSGHFNLLLSPNSYYKLNS